MSNTTVPQPEQNQVRQLTTDEVYKAERVLLEMGDEQPAALCLSGGGIRSAAFCLGALQALAEHRLLGHFHYLSTVSGGGYIGGWLTRCLDEHGSDIAAIETEVLATGQADEPKEVRRLRRYTNYLTPHPGLASNDTWAGIMLWLRNTLINWAVFLPLMLAAMSVPILYVGLIRCSDAFPAWRGVVSTVAGIVGILVLGVAVHNTCLDLPSHSHPDMPAGKPPEKFGPDGKEVRSRIIHWALAWSLIAPLAVAPWLQRSEIGRPWQDSFWSPKDACRSPPASLKAGSIKTDANAITIAVTSEPPAAVPCQAAPTAKPRPTSWQLVLLPMASFAACVLAFLLAWISLRRDYTAKTEHMRLQSNAFLYNLPAWLGSSALSAFLLWIGLRLAVGASATSIAIFGPVWVITADMLRSTAYVAVRIDGLRSDLDREWLARLNGSKLRIVLALGAMGVTATVLPRALLQHIGAFYAGIAGIAGFLAGPVAALIGKSARIAFLPGTRDGAESSWLRPDWIVAASILVFTTSLFTLVGRLVVVIIAALLRARMPLAASNELAAACEIGLAVGVLCAIAGLTLGRVLNLNRFSMHAVYRNRLVRAFLGTARTDATRRPDRYTSFDPADNIRMCDTFHSRKALFPIVNVTLNRTSGKDTARAERKAEPFVITPLHCGSSFLSQGEGAFVSTASFARGEKLSGPDDKQKGITLGTAMALSGASVSPNMGYASSPLTAFVMTMFNVRLGAWLPNPGSRNPAFAALMERAGPRNAVTTTFKELIGSSDDKGDYVYLSDGGHFDNLGLYEMLDRRCGRIVVIDAGRDQNYGYADLGRALERALIDRGVTVDFIGPLKIGDDKLDPHGAYARVTYPAQANRGAQSGELIYLKPWVPDDAPAELRAYQVRNKDFPHDPTTDQFFTESDFESYRRLAEYLGSKLITDALAADAARPPKVEPSSWSRHGDCRRPQPNAVDAGATKALEGVFAGVRALAGAAKPDSTKLPMLDAIRRVLSDDLGPALQMALTAMLWVGRGDLDRAHHCAHRHAGDPDCDLVHAHLHRRQGELEAARLWYYCAGRSHATLPVEEEWIVISTHLLARAPGRSPTAAAR